MAIKKNNHILSIAVVDDDSVVRNGLSSLLNSVPELSCIGVYRDVSEAMAGLQKQMPDILLLDVSLPGTSGIDAIQPMRERFPEMKIIMHSNFDHEEKIMRAMQAGASGYTLKNQGVSALHEAILTVGSGGSVWPPGFEKPSGADQRTPKPSWLSAIVHKCRKFFGK